MAPDRVYGAAMAQSLYPTLIYEDAHAGIAWLETALGGERKDIYEDDGVVEHAEIRVGGDLLMLGQVREGGGAAPARTGSLYLAVDDIQAYWERAQAAGAEVTRELHDTDYGSRDFAVRDPEGNLFSLGTYRPEVVAAALVLFDVNETLADLSALGRRFAEVRRPARSSSPVADRRRCATGSRWPPPARRRRSPRWPAPRRSRSSPASPASDRPRPPPITSSAGMGELTPASRAPTEALAHPARRRACAWPRSPTARRAPPRACSQRAGVAELAEAHLAAIDFGRWKPAPEPYRGACAQLGVRCCAGRRAGRGAPVGRRRRPARRAHRRLGGAGAGGRTRRRC